MKYKSFHDPSLGTIHLFPCNLFVFCNLRLRQIKKKSEFVVDDGTQKAGFMHHNLETNSFVDARRWRRRCHVSLPSNWLDPFITASFW